MARLVIGREGGAMDIEGMEEVTILLPKSQVDWLRMILSVSPLWYIMTEVDKTDGRHRIMSADLGILRGDK